MSLNGTVVYDNGNITVQILSGQFAFDSDFTVSGEFQNGRLTSFDSDIVATLKLDMTLQGNFQTSGDWDGSKPLMAPIHSFKLLGFVGPVPVWVESVLELRIGYEAHLAAQGSATWGFQSSRRLTYGASLRNGQWSKYSQESSSFIPFTPGWQIGGSGRLQGYLEPKLTVYLEGLAGPSADLKPNLELEGNACVQPGQAGADISLYAGLNSTLAIDVRGWDPAEGTLPSWELFNLRKLIWHKNLATSASTPPQTIPNMVWIPCGTFRMGSPASEPGRYVGEGPQMGVTLSQGFWMGKYEVTQGEFLAVMSNNPSYFNGVRDYIDRGIDLSRPVEMVSWNDAVAYCAALTTREQSAGRLPAGYVYRLPTEAEWEYACRAGTTTPFHYGNELRSGMANSYCGSEYLVGDPDHRIQVSTCLGGTASVGSYAPNAWGLYDMHGNVGEWCQDWAGPYPGGSLTDPQGPAAGYNRVVRGGSWRHSARDCRSAFRTQYDPTHPWWDEVGFRVVLAPGQP